MKIIGIASSPRHNGNSATVLREALKGAQEAGAETEEIYLPDYDISVLIHLSGAWGGVESG